MDRLTDTLLPQASTAKPSHFKDTASVLGVKNMTFVFVPNFCQDGLSTHAA